MTYRMPPTRAAAHRAAVLALVLALVLAQALGAIHRSLHGASGESTLVDTGAHELYATVDADTMFDALFGSHADGSDCRLFNALAQPGCTPVAVVLPALVLSAAALLSASHSDFVARWSALFDARGPPPSR